MADLDHRGKLGPLGVAILNALLFTEPEQLIAWSVQAAKTEIASIAVTVFATAAKGDALSKRILADAATMLAEDACACAHQLMPNNRDPVEFVLNGGVILNNPGFQRDVSRRLKKAWPSARITPLVESSVLGAVTLARQAAVTRGAAPSSPHEIAAEWVLPAPIADMAVLTASPTEKRNPRSMKLDQMPLAQGIELMLAEDAHLTLAIRAERKISNG
jgi:hypothetical protein